MLDQSGQRGQREGGCNPKGRAKGILGKNTGDLYFGFGRNRPAEPISGQPPQAHVYLPGPRGQPEQYGQQGLEGVRQGVGEMVWTPASDDGVPGYKLLVGDLPPEWTPQKVSTLIV